MVVSPKVFISYAREDREQALRLSRHLEALGAQPWVDLTHMIPGGDWRVQIEDALDACDYVVLLLSHNSIEKNGFVQVEKRYILDRLDHMPLGAIFLIPARLEKCNPRHRQIQRIHRIDLFPSWDEGVGRIAKAIGLPKEAIPESEVPRERIRRERKKLSIEDYFEVVLPTMLRWKGEKATKLNKKVRFALLDQPDQSWTINFVQPKATVVAKDQSKVNLTIRLTSGCMEDVLAGTFDSRKAIADGDIELQGDPGVLKTVGSLFLSGSIDPSV